MVFSNKHLSHLFSSGYRDRTDTPVKEREEAKDESLEKKFKHSEARKKKCPDCPISFVFQVPHLPQLFTLDAVLK